MTPSDRTVTEALRDMIAKQIAWLMPSHWEKMGAPARNSLVDTQLDRLRENLAEAGLIVTTLSPSPAPVPGDEE